MHHETSIGILFFSRTAKTEALSKRWLNSYPHDLAAARALREKTMKSLSDTGLPICVYDEYSQVGSTFGDRIQNAFKDMFDRGYSHVVAVGADLPSIGDIDWGQIKSHLQVEGAVLGPDLRGGVYLIGLSRSHFKRINLAKLPWQTRRLFKELIQQLGQIHLLGALADINSAADLRSFSKEGRGLSRLIRILIFTSEEFNRSVRYFFKCQAAFILLPERAPPEFV